MAIGAGDLVECIESCSDAKGDRVVSGEIYRVDALQPHYGEEICSRCGSTTGLLLSSDHYRDGAWCVARFRLLRKVSAGAFDYLLIPGF